MRLAVALATFTLVVPPASSQDTGPGISRELARSRRARIGDITYRLRFDLEAAKDSVDGFVQIVFELRDEPTPVADLVLDFAGTSIDVRSVNSRRPNAAFTVTANHLLIPRDLLVSGLNYIEAKFTAPVAATGTPLTRYVDTTDGAEYLYTLVVPADAHGLFPCFDQPDLKATFRLSLTLPGNWVAIANTDGDANPETDGLVDAGTVQVAGRTFACFGPTKPLPTYLFAFAAGPFAQIEDSTAAGIAPDRTRPLRLSMRRSRLQHADTDLLFELHRNAVGRLGDWFGIPYPFGKLEFVLVPGFPYGGMEHAGAIFYRETALVFERPPTEPEQVRRSTLIYHEVAHQWFGNLVTMEWFDDLWLKEGFATFLAYMLLEELEPSRQAWLRFLQIVKARAYAIDETSGTTPIWQALPNLADAKSAYGAIVYNKAPAVLRELQQRLGAESFRTAVSRFVADHTFGNATWSDLVEAFRTQGGLEDQDWSQRWILGKGLPRVRVAWTSDSDGVVDSCRLLQHGANDDDSPWPLALELRVFEADGTTRDVAIRTSQGELELNELVGRPSPHAILLNPRDLAYGLFTLDEKSATWLQKRVVSIVEPLARVATTAQLWQSTRELGLDPREWTATLLALIESEHDPNTHEWLLDRLAFTLDRYLTGSARDERLAQAERLALAQLVEDRPASRLALLRFLASTSRSVETLSLLRGILDGEHRIEGLELEPRDRFLFAAALLAAGDAAAVEREKDHTLGGADIAKWAYVAGAASPDPKVKELYFADYLRADGPPEQWVQDSLSFFHWPGQGGTTAPYLPRALDHVEEAKRTRKIFFMPAWIDAFVNGHSDATSLATVQNFLTERTDLASDIRDKILQSVDELARTVRIRERWE